MLTVHISKHTTSADWDNGFQFCTEALATGYYLKAKVLFYYKA